MYLIYQANSRAGALLIKGNHRRTTGSPIAHLDPRWRLGAEEPLAAKLFRDIVLGVEHLHSVACCAHRAPGLRTQIMAMGRHLEPLQRTTS